MKFTREQWEANEAKQHKVPFCASAEDLPADFGKMEGCDDESKLHRQIIDECQRRGWIVFHGSMAHATFRTPGEPDFVILGSTPAHPMVLLIECKTRTAKLSVDQQAIHAWAAKLGHTVHVVRSFAQFLEIIA